MADVTIEITVHRSARRSNRSYLSNDVDSVVTQTQTVGATFDGTDDDRYVAYELDRVLTRLTGEAAARFGNPNRTPSSDGESWEHSDFYS